MGVLNGLIGNTLYIRIYIIFAFSIMEQSLFSDILWHALASVAKSHGCHYPDGGAHAWGQAGAAYLGFALCNLSSGELRQKQYSARDNYGPVILDCKWYDTLVQECLKGHDNIEALLPGTNGTFATATVSRELFLEMLDFCREG